MTSDIATKIKMAQSLYREEVLARFPAIKSANDHSVESLDRIRAHLAQNPPNLDLGVEVLAVAGSLARLEASCNSDIDLIVATDPELSVANLDEDLISWRDSLCAALDMDAPNKKGVFAEPVSRSDLERVAGEAGEPYATTAKRALLILESKWVYNEEAYETLLSKITTEYAADVNADPNKNFVFLLNDITRYFRALCVNYQFTKTETEYGKWPIRNIKLRHSRVLMYFSMIAAIGCLSTDNSATKVDALGLLIRMSPLERLFVSYDLSSDGNFSVFAEYYNTFLESMAAIDVRTELEGLEYEKRYNSEHFSRLKKNSDELSTEILRFYDSRKDGWDQRFFEYMII